MAALQARWPRMHSAREHYKSRKILMPQKSYSHIAVRFPPKLRERLVSRQCETGARSFNAVVRAELEGRLPRWRPCRAILGQSRSASRDDLWLPPSLVSNLRIEAHIADANLSDFVVTILSEGDD